jgi:plastocyanin
MSMGGNVKVGQLYTWVNQGVEHNISISKIDDNNVYYIFDGRNKVDTKSEFDKIIKENNLVAGYNL